MTAIVFRPAADSDWGAVAELLSEAGLTLEGAREHLSGFILAWRGADLAGCAGLELYGRDGLLRSVAVRASERGAGLGQAITREVLTAAQAAGLRQVVLLTETAPDFFPKFGFQTIARSIAPEAVRASLEFMTACSESAVAMLKTL
jgi:amino-acid N-acetyltransferase